MATVAHCLFAFETLAAHLEDREATPLAAVQKSWSAYAHARNDKHDDGPATSTTTTTTTTTTRAKLAKQPPALRRLAAASSSSSSSPSSSSSSSTTSLPQPPNSDADTSATSVESMPSEEDGDEDEDEDEDGDDPDSPLFVTWNADADAGRHGGYALRGCIGTFEAQPLEAGLASYALTAALHDTRFRPVERRELPGLAVAVTLLTDFEDAAGAMDWTLGTHGLRVSFHDRGRRYGATYLPDVAPEQGWSKEETLLSLMRKAGWQGPKDQWADVELKVVRYQGRKRSLEYAEYKRWRDWADERAKEHAR